MFKSLIDAASQGFNAVMSTEISEVAAELGRNINTAEDWSQWTTMAESIAKVTGTTVPPSNLAMIASLAYNVVSARSYLQKQIAESPELSAAAAAATDSLAVLKSLPDDAVEPARAQINDLAGKLTAVQRLVANAPRAAGDYVQAQITEAIFGVIIEALLSAPLIMAVSALTVPLLLHALPVLIFLPLMLI